jgi:F-type H+-transporting ATPase subunit delta
MSDKSAARSQQYAQAAFQAQIEQWQSALTSIADTLAHDADLMVLLRDSSKEFAQRVDALVARLPQGVSAEMVNLLKLLLQEGDLDMLPQIAASLTTLASGRQAPVRADVTSAVELAEKDKEALRSSLRKQYGDDLIFSFNVDPSLMGGLRVRVGDRLIDTSIASRLATLRDSLASAAR